VRFSAFDSGVHRLGVAVPAGERPQMDNDILIALLMTLGSLVWLGVIIAVVARATRETPRPKHDAVEPAPTLRPAPGW